MLQTNLLCFWQDKYFVCVQAGGGSDESRQTVVDLARAISAKLPPGGEVPALVGYLPEDDLIAYSSRYFHGHPSLNYHYYLSTENILKLGKELSQSGQGE